jgi:hypothetical protein
LSDRALLLGRGDRLGLRMLLAGPMRGVAGRLGLARLAAASQRGLLDGDGSVLVLLGGAGAGIGDRVGAGGGPDVGRSQSPRELMAAGRALMRCWYALAELDVSVHPLSQLLDCPVTAPQIAARAGAAGSQVLAVFRAGHAEGAVPRSARIPSGI